MVPISLNRLRVAIQNPLYFRKIRDFGSKTQILDGAERSSIHPGLHRFLYVSCLGIMSYDDLGRGIRILFPHSRSGDYRRPNLSKSAEMSNPEASKRGFAKFPAAVRILLNRIWMKAEFGDNLSAG